MRFDYEAFELLCLAIGKAPTAAAEEAGIARNQPGKWKKGVAEPSNTSVKKLAVYFDVPIEHFFFGTEVDEAAAIVAREMDLNDMELELVRVFRTLSIKKQTRLLSLAYEFEESEYSA